MKYFGVIALALLVACVALSEAQSHNIQFGTVGPNDILLHREIVMKKPNILKIVTKDFKYPPKGQSQERTISAVKCTDQYRNGQGGYASLYAGGPGSRDVTVRFKSQRGQGVHFIVEVFGQ